MVIVGIRGDGGLMARTPTEDEISKQLVDMTTVDHTRLARAKQATLHFATDRGVTSGDALVESVVKDLGGVDPGSLMLHPSVDFDSAHLKRWAEFLSVRLAASEA